MGSWGAPLAAAAFWAGLLLWDVRPGFVLAWPAWTWLILGVAGLAASWIAATCASMNGPGSMTATSRSPIR